MADKNSLPSRGLFAARRHAKSGEEKSSCAEIGVAFPNKNGFMIQRHAMPLDGRYVPLPREETRQAERASASRST